MITAVALSALDVVDLSDHEVVRHAADESDTVETHVLDDDIVLHLTGRLPIMPAHERLAIVRYLRDVALAALFSDSAYVWAGEFVKVVGRFDLVSSGVTPRRLGWALNSAGRRGRCSAVRDRPEGLTVGYVPGDWDLFHIDHLNVAGRAREHCDVLIAGVVTDEALAQATRKMPSVSLSNRISVVSALKIVEHVVVDYSSSEPEVWERVQFDVLFEGDDWQGAPKGDRLRPKCLASEPSFTTDRTQCRRHRRSCANSLRAVKPHPVGEPTKAGHFV